MIDTKLFREIEHLHKIAVFEEIDSTNRAGISMVKAGIKEFLIIACKQTKGRGRFKRKWISSEGGAYFSLGLNVGNIAKPQLLTFVCASAIMDMLKSFDIKPEFKWPNDVLVRGRKISGVLIELTDHTAICGIGINVNNSVNEREHKAISMKQIKNEEFVIEQVIAHTVSRIYNALGNEGMIMHFVENNPMKGRSVKIDTVSGMYRGKVLGLSSDGAIIINTDNGPREFFEGDLSLEEW